MKLQIKRGNKANLPTLAEGEFGLAKDTKELFIGNTGGHLKVATSEHTHALTDAAITGSLPVAKGGTGATTAANARTNLGITPDNIGAAKTITRTKVTMTAAGWNATAKTYSFESQYPNATYNIEIEPIDCTEEQMQAWGTILPMGSPLQTY